MAIDNTVGGATANTYLSEVEFDTYVEFHPFSSVVMPDSETYLTYSTRLLETLVSWRGTPASDTQSLHFPLYGETTIPEVIKNAQAELIIHMIENGDFQAAGGDFDVIEFGHIRIEPNTKLSTGEMLPPLVKSMLAPYGSVRSVGGKTLTSVNVVRA